jgi:alpha-glucuronidase
MIGTYNPEVAKLFEDISTCPDDVVGFLHHVNYTHRLHSGETVIQRIYDSHFAGVESVKRYQAIWSKFQGRVPDHEFENVRDRLDLQLQAAIEWRDRVNTYFWRHSRIRDEKPGPGRVIYA